MAVLWMAAGAMTLTSACAGNTNETEAAEPVPATTVTVDNRAFLDMTVYVYRSSQRVRLGMVNGNSKAKFVIPPNLLFGSTPLRFQADPIGGNRQPVTQELAVAPGDDIIMIIPSGI